MKGCRVRHGQWAFHVFADWKDVMLGLEEGGTYPPGQVAQHTVASPQVVFSPPPTPPMSHVDQR